MIILVNRKNRKVSFSTNFIGNEKENRQEKIVFTFEDEFVDGTARLEYEIKDEKKYVLLDKNEETYEIDVLSVMTIEGNINMQLVITEGTEEESVPVFKSNKFHVYCGESINAVEEAPEDIDLWIEKANAKLNAMDIALEQVDNIDINAEKIEDTATITITKKDGSIESVEIKDGEQGPSGADGKDALINGKNTISILAGENTSIRQEDDKLYIDSEAGYDDTELRNKINKVDEDLGLVQDDVQSIHNDIDNLEDNKADKTEIPDVSQFITNTVNNLTNYYLKSETYTQEEVNQLIGAIKTAHFEVVESLPEIGEENIIYLVPKQEPKLKDIYEEYIWVNNDYELIGTTEIDLSNYLTKDEFGLEKYDYVKDGLVNNTNTLTDSEKLKIETWLGLAETYLTMYNETPYQVNSDYNPAHKKYVDEADTLLRERISEIELSKFPNATIIGTPTIQQGQVSNFSLSDYLEFPFLVDFRNRPFEINFAFTTNQDVDNQQNILDSDFGLAFAIRNKHLVLALSFNGTSWATEQTGSLILQPQITYRIKITWNRLSYKVQYSLDGGNTYIDDITFGATQAPYPRQMYIGTGKLAQNYFKGIINMNYSDVYISGNKIWQGMDDAGLSLRMSVSMDNIDELGVAYINSLIDAKIGNIDTLLQDIDTGEGI